MRGSRELEGVYFSSCGEVARNLSVPFRRVLGLEWVLGVEEDCSAGTSDIRSQSKSNGVGVGIIVENVDDVDEATVVMVAVDVVTMVPG